MPFIPHTPEDLSAMLASVGAASLDALFDEIPAELLSGDLSGLPPALNEMQVTRLATERAEADGRWLSFLGAGAYEHHIPAAVWQLAGRGEFYTAYTPYQAEASQGTLQLLYEWQTMMSSLTGMDVSNASLYDGASALSEALLMAVRASKKGVRRVLLAASLNPLYRSAAKAIVSQQGIEVVDIAFDADTGRIDRAALEAAGDTPFAALAIGAPNFFGVLEEPDEMTDWTHGKGALMIGVCNPLALALLAPPGEWGKGGADIACGDGQPLGIPLSGGGPYLGYLTCKAALVRQMPGRIVGRTLDLEGRPGFTLTLQAREQHIRRSKATSNICTNQGLMVTVATMHMALVGAEGLKNVALQSHANTRALLDLLTAIPNVKRVFAAPFFHEAVIRIHGNVEEVLRALRARGILGGYALGRDYPELADAILFCATETRTQGDMDSYAEQLERILSRRREGPRCTMKPRNPESF
jgi:glycine dehydrogenase subunit 1